jgi:branched-chain amino acid transport system permease protein
MTAVILDGIVLGLQFGLLGMGLSLIYGLGGVLNLAHGQLAMLGAITVVLVIDRGVGTPLAVLAGLAVASAAGLLLDRSLMLPVYRQRGERRVLLGLLLMLGVAFVIEGVLVWRYPIESLSIPISGGTVSILGVGMRRGSLVASAISVAAGAVLVAALRFTTIGRAVRSVVQDEEGAQLCGVNPAFVRSLNWIVAAGLAALVAVTRSMTAPVAVATAGIDFTILALIVAVVGGLGSAGGALLAGVLLGIVNTVSSYYIGTYITTIVLLAAAALTLVIRPAGLLGTSR